MSESIQQHGGFRAKFAVAFAALGTSLFALVPLFSGCERRDAASDVQSLQENSIVMLVNRRSWESRLLSPEEIEAVQSLVRASSRVDELPADSTLKRMLPPERRFEIIYGKGNGEEASLALAPPQFFWLGSELYVASPEDYFRFEEALSLYRAD